MGTEKSIFVGWSVEVSMIMQYLNRYEPSNVAGAVFISPALDWKGVPLDHLRRAGARNIGAWMAWAMYMVRFPGVCRLFDTEEASGPKNANDMPGLVLRGTSDNTVPLEFTQGLLARCGENVQLVEFLDARHTLEWNANAHKWAHSIAQWCQGMGMGRGCELDGKDA